MGPAVAHICFYQWCTCKFMFSGFFFRYFWKYEYVDHRIIFFRLWRMRSWLLLLYLYSVTYYSIIPILGSIWPLTSKLCWHYSDVSQNKWHFVFFLKALICAQLALFKHCLLNKYSTIIWVELILHVFSTEVEYTVLQYYMLIWIYNVLYIYLYWTVL